MNVPKEVNDALGLLQAQLQAAIIRHQNLWAILKKDETNEELRRAAVEAVQEVTRIGMEQKILFNRMRAYREPRISEEQEDRPESESSSSNEENLRESLSDDSIEIVPQPESIYPEHMEQVNFMGLFGVGTHEFHDHMVKKRSTRGKCAAARPYFYMPVDADHRKKQKNKEKYLNWKVTTRKTKPRDSQNGKQRKDKMKVLNKSRSADEMCNQTPRQCPKSSKKPVTTVSRN